MTIFTNPWTYLILILAQLLAIHLNPIDNDGMPFHIHNPFHHEKQQQQQQQQTPPPPLPQRPLQPHHQQGNDREDASTIQNKLMMGYQGWFSAAGDGPPVHPGHHGWIHWFGSPLPDGGRPQFDMWPSLKEFDQDELYNVPGLTMPNGEQAKLFSSRHPKTVDRHFRWMKEHSIPGVFLQRFLSQVKNGDDGLRRLRDEIGFRVREAAENNGRVWAVMWDVSGNHPDMEEAVLKDWDHMVNVKKILESPAYLHEDGRPIIGIWGMGLKDKGHDPAACLRLVRRLREASPRGVYIFAGTPTYWHAGTGDMEADPAWLEVWKEVDAISPWAVGRYRTLEHADNYDREKTQSDMQIIAKESQEGVRKRDYVPVVFPGFSWGNLQDCAFNEIPRQNGEFLWRQIYNAHQSGAKIIYGAMFDELDESTNMMPSEPLTCNLPKEKTFLALDADGEHLPDDWYLRICQLSAEALKMGGRQQLPEKMPWEQLQRSKDRRRDEL